MANRPIIHCHCLVRNEERWVYFAITSVLSYIDKLHVWDTGSTDRTVEIIQKIDSQKIHFRQYGPTDASRLTSARNEMLRHSTEADWIFLLDGDEVWPEQSISEAVALIAKSPHKLNLICPFINMVGDIYHKLPDNSGQYHIHELIGDYSIRFTNRKIPGLKVIGSHGQQTYVDRSQTPVQNMPRSTFIQSSHPYWHMTHLVRSSTLKEDKQVTKRSFKHKIELGERTYPRFNFPEVFFTPHPAIVPDPWSHMTSQDLVLGFLTKQAKRIRRVLLPKAARIGY